MNVRIPKMKDEPSFHKPFREDARVKQAFWNSYQDLSAPV